MTTVLVTGARGNTGREVAALLAKRSGVTVRGGSSDPSRIGITDVMPVRFDWAEPDSWAAAVDGADAVYLARPDIEDAPERVHAFIAAAPRLENIVLLSEMGAERMAAETWVRRVEQAFLARAEAWTILRPTWFAQVLTDERFFLDTIREQRRFEMPSAGAAISFIDTRDIAAVAVEALLDARHVGQAYTLSGPRAMALDEVAELVGAALGTKVRHVEPKASQVIADVAEAGDEPWLLEVMTDLYERVRGGKFAAVTDAVERVSGAAPRTLEAFVAEHASRWRA